MKKQPYFPFLIFSLLTLVALLAIFRGPALLSGAQPDPLTMSFSDWPGDQVFAFVDLLELDKEYNLALALRGVPAADDQLAAWRSKQVDLQVVTLDTAFILAESDEIRIIYAYDDSFGADGMLAVEDIRSPSDLRDQTIGVEFGYTSHFLTLNLLAQAGLTPANVTLVDVQYDEIAAAFQSGQVTAVATWEPQVSDMLTQIPGLHLLSSSRDFPELILNVIVVRASALQANRRAYVNLIRATDAATRHCQANLHSCLGLLATKTGRSVEQWKADLQGVRLLDLAVNQRLLTDPGPSGLVAKLDAVHDFLRTNRPTMPTLDVSQWVDSSLVEEAAKK